MKSLQLQARHHRRHHRRRNSPTSSSSALPSPTTSEQQSSSATSAVTARDSFPSTNTTSSGTDTSISTNSSSSNDFIQQNPRYASLWLQKCLLPKRLAPSTLTGAAPHYLSPDCYPYPSMADAVDRVFVHALHTVKRLPRSGSARPPEHSRLLLYGLYKQATEGDVAGLIPPPPQRTGPSSPSPSREEVAEREKWDAWAANGGMGKTEAKRAYIAALLGTMKRFAMGTGEARELVGELEFVWGQIKDGGSGSGSPGEGVSAGGGARRRRREGDDDDAGAEGRVTVERREGLKVLRPMSEGDEVQDIDDDQEEEEEEFQDPEQGEVFEGDGIKEPSGPGLPTRATDLDVRNRKWRKRMELALGKLSVEIAALREQIESQRDGVSGRTGGGVLTWARWLLSILMRHVLVDGVVLLLLVAWARRKEDRRLEQGLQLFYYWIREQVGRIRVPDTVQRAVKSMQNVMR